MPAMYCCHCGEGYSRVRQLAAAEGVIDTDAHPAAAELSYANGQWHIVAGD